ncbi:protein Mis18-alpha isoform X3 [Salvelinus fontinalis]|uniref:protein Mis18-alpha isoform X3 n=1 Tax=Salvelinus fontinalis TaxID=8038 RepID=UPI00248699F2|nr:protein Mis18-alpha isoform X3 [Salvelinus fontinalis]
MSGRKALRKESNVTFEVTVDGGAYADSTVIKDNSKQGLLGEDDDSDPPVVFLCGSCKLPVGDSLSWAGSEDEQSQILLKRVSDNVLIGKETHISGTRKKDLGCLIVHLTCCGCSSLLGLVYISTPRKLDYIRSLFCLDVAAIESLSFQLCPGVFQSAGGSGEPQAAAGHSGVQTGCRETTG